MKHPSKISNAILAVLLALVLVIADSNSVFAQAGTWTTKTSMPAARSVAAAGVINGVLYVAGGHDGVVGGTTTLQAYNPTTDTWNTLAAMPGRRYAGNGAGVIEGELYVAGGWNYPDSSLPQSQLFVYNPGTNSWRTETSMPTLSADGASGVINGKLYVTTAANGYSGWRDFLHVYDPATNSWSSLAPSPNAHADPAFGVINNKFYVAGGGDDTGTHAKLDVYDPSTNTWTTKASMPAPRQGAVGGVIGGKLYVIGGSNAGVYYNTVYVYDPSTDTWTTETSVPTARGGAVAGVVNGALYVAGGANSTGTLATVEAFTPGQELVNLSLNPSTLNVQQGDIFTINIRVDARTQPVDAAQAYINFESNRLRVVDANGNETNQIINGELYNTVWPDVLTNTVNNSTGQIGYAAGKGISGSAANTLFTLATIRFKAMTQTNGTPTAIVFNTSVPRATKVVQGLNTITGTLTGGTVFIAAAPNQPPVALFTYSPEQPNVNQEVTFNASASYDPDGAIVSYQWEFGDGGTGTGEIVEHSYLNPGEFGVILTVTDDVGATDQDGATVTVAQPPPPVRRRSLPDPSTYAMVGSGLAAVLLYIGLSRLRSRSKRN